nr:hypothetical protein [uncultured Albidiferax sp.]
MSAAVAQAAAPRTREELLERDRLGTLSRYTAEQQAAALLVYRLVKRCPDTGGGIRAAKFLLGLYNGPRFPFDLTDLRCFDPSTFQAAMVVLRMDAEHTYCEIHVLLNAILGPSANVGAELEHWAYDIGLKGCCKKSQLPALRRA